MSNKHTAEQAAWNKPDEDGTIHVPDYLDPLVNKVGMQIRFHTISGKGEVETVCDIVKNAEEFFKAQQQAVNPWVKASEILQDMFHLMDHQDEVGKSHIVGYLHDKCIELDKILSSQPAPVVDDKLTIALEALNFIANPIASLQDQAKKEGCDLDGVYAISFSEKGSNLSKIAVDALQKIKKL